MEALITTAIIVFNLLCTLWIIQKHSKVSLKIAHLSRQQVDILGQALDKILLHSFELPEQDTTPFVHETVLIIDKAIVKARELDA